MIAYVVRRVLLMIPMLLIVSILCFILIQLPPGDFLSSELMRLSESGQVIDDALVDSLERRYGLNRPLYEQYLLWMKGIILRGDFGRSFGWNQPVSQLIWERLPWTMVLSLGSLLFTWIVAFPIGVYSATHQYSLADYVFTFLGFLGQSIPSFLLALILMWVGFRYLGVSMGGLFSPEFSKAPWSLAKFLDLLGHLWVPIIIIGTAGTAGLIRTLRANLLDELRKPYVMVARAKGVSGAKLIWKYPLRIAINPFISSVGGILPQLISGAGIVAIVLSLPTTGPLMLNALLVQDMYLAGSFLMMLTVLSLIGTLLSDILLALIDPRIRQTV